MDSSIGLWLLLAITFFWLTGLYNRLMRLRARAIEVHTELEMQVALFAKGLTAHDETLPLSSTSESSSEKDVLGAWQEVMYSVQAVNRTWTSSPRKSLGGNDQRRRAESWAELQSRWYELLAMPLETTVVAQPIESLLLLKASGQKARSIQEALNAIIDSYNAALREYPARCVALMMGFSLGEKI